MEAAVSGAARWADTYLLANDPASAGLAAAFGLHGGGPAVLQALVQVANTLLSQYVAPSIVRPSSCTRLALLLGAQTAYQYLWLV